ncbi:MAG: flagellar filament capping protein FliD [Phycisphaerae bacterium]|nr:flagellar filament capping protein FliD [Phycisphaerae bacterium]
MPSIALNGLGSGIDTSAMLTALVEAEKGRMYQLQVRRASIGERNSAMDQLKSKLQSLRSSLENLSSMTNLRAFTAASSNEQAVSVKVGTAASEGSHEVIINRLASAQRDVHAGTEEKTSLVGQGSFSYTYNGITRTVHTTAETTLEGLRDLINRDAGNPGVTASLLEHDNGDGKAFHMVLSGNDSGSKYAITINDSLTTLNGDNGTVDFRQSSFLQTQAAQNSQVRVNGYPNTGWIERSGNTIDDVIPGVTLNLHRAETTQITISRDTAALKKNLTEWVNAYNSTIDSIKSLTGYDAKTKVAGALMGDSTVNAIRRQISDLLLRSANGFEAGSDAYTLAREIGLTVDRDGKMQLDESVLDEAVKNNYQGVLALLGASGSGTSSSAAMQFYSSSARTQSGAYEVQANFDSSGNLLSARIRGVGESAWRDALVEDNVIYGNAGQPEHGLVVTAVWDGHSTTQSATIRVREGLANSLYNRLGDILADQTGTISMAGKGFQASIDALDASILREQERLDRFHVSLQQKFARLETTLTQMRSQQNALLSFLGQ